MDPTSWLIFAGAVFIASYVQSVIGFAMGMIVMAIVGASDAVSLPTLTAAVSIISFVNIVVALNGHLNVVHRRVLGWLILSQIPAILVGLYLLTVLDREAQAVLRFLLGLFIAGGSLSTMIRPAAQATVSGRLSCVAAGLSGGIIGGLFSASGPVIGWFLYRQPLPLVTIRATMLCFFGLGTFSRTVIVGIQGGLSGEVWWLSAIAFPLVVIGAWLGRIKPPPLSDLALKRAVFFLLFALGVFIMASAFLDGFRMRQ